MEEDRRDKKASKGHNYLEIKKSRVSLDERREKKIKRIRGIDENSLK